MYNYVVVWINILLQLLLPLSISIYPAMAKTPTSSPTPPSEVQFYDQQQFAQHLLTGSNLLADDNTSLAAANMARSFAVGKANDSLQHWFNQFGTAQVQLNLNDDFNLAESSFDLLTPVYDDEQLLLFSQFGLRNKNSRNTFNLGAGIRTFQDRWMYGANFFFDRDMTGKNQRFSLGVEAWADHLKLSANRYFRLTDWHQSRDFSDYNERPADGYDLRLNAYLPAYPHLGGMLSYEQYWGNEVALFGKDDRQKNPYAVSYGINYTPIPLLTLSLDQHTGNSDKQEARFAMQLNYRFGTSWQSQIEPSAVAASRTLAGSRFDLVERNNHIVLDYQKQDLIQLVLPEQASGYAFTSIDVHAQVTSKYDLQRIAWDAPALIAAGGSIIPTTPHSISIKLPPYQPDNHTYALTAVAYDHLGNASKRNTTQIIVIKEPTIIVDSSSEVFPSQIPADGVAFSMITLRLKDEDQQPITGIADILTVDVTFTPAIPTSYITKGISHPHLSDPTEIEPGVYAYQLTSGLTSGEVLLEASIKHLSLASATVTLHDEHNVISPEHSLFEVEPAEIIADGIQSSTLIFTAQDNQHHPVSGLTVAFEVTGPEVVLSDVTENEGVYRARLRGKTAGLVKVTPSANGERLEGQSREILLVADKSATLDLAVLVDDALADGVEMNQIEVKLTDPLGNPVAGKTALFDVNNGATLGNTENATDEKGMTTITVSNTNAGVTTVTATLDNLQQSIDVTFTPVTPMRLSIYRNGIELAEHPVVGDILEAVTLCSIALCNEIPMDYQWEIESHVGSGTFVALPAVTSSIWTVTRDVQKRAIRVVVN